MADKYYAMIDGERRGPFTLEELPEAGVRPSTYIWCKGMEDWQKAEDNADVCRLFRNHLYDKMHPEDSSLTTPLQNGQASTEDSNNPWKVSPDNPDKHYPTKYDRYLQETGQDPLPTLEEIEAKKDKTIPPVSMIGYAWIVTIFFCLPLGIVALVYAYKSKNAWKDGKNEESHEYSRLAKMWTGISLFVGIIIYGLFLALSL